MATCGKIRTNHNFVSKWVGHAVQFVLEYKQQTYHQIIWYPNSTHVITVSKDRKQFEGDVVAFLSQIKWNEE